MEEKNWSWEQWLNKLADYSVEIPDTYDEFNGKIKATCSLGSSTDIYHIRFERVNYRGETVVNDIYLNNDEMKVVMDFAERLSDKKLVEEKELDRAREEGYKEGRRYQMELNEMLNGVSVQENTLEKGKEYVVISKETYNKLTTK